MGNHTGNGRIVLDKATRSRYSYLPPLSNILPDSRITNAAGKQGRPGRAPLDKRNHKGQSLGSFPGDENFGPVIFSPLEINAGLIVDTTSQKIKIWNTNLKNEATISQIQLVNPAGITLHAPAVLINIPRGNDQVHGLDILKNGPAVQNSQLIYTVNTISESISITGQRLIAFVFEPNWDDNIDFGYKFHTVLYQNRRFHEQRRPLYNKSLRELRATYLFQGQAFQKFLHVTRGQVNRILGIPIYQDVATPINDLMGLTTINVNEDISKFYNFGRATLILILDRANLFGSEVKTIASKTATSITVEVPIAGNFKRENTVIYPLFAGILVNKKYVPQTDNVVIADLDFREIITNG